MTSHPYGSRATWHPYGSCYLSISTCLAVRNLTQSLPYPPLEVSPLPEVQGELERHALPVQIFPKLLFCLLDDRRFR